MHTHTHPRGKRDGREDSVSKHQVQPVKKLSGLTRMGDGAADHVSRDQTVRARVGTGRIQG